MYGIKDRIEPGVFVGLVLEQLCLTVNTLTLLFSNEVLITVESSFACGLGLEALDRRVSVPGCNDYLVQSIGKLVQHVEIIGEGTLLLEVKGGTRFACFDDSETYESYRISIRGNEIIV